MRFPNGFTLLDGQGKWRGSRGVVRENSHVRILFHPSSQEQVDKIEALRSIYETRFGQELGGPNRRLGLRGVLTRYIPVGKPCLNSILVA